MKINKEVSNKESLTILINSLGSGGAEKVVSLLLPFLTNKFKITLVLFTDIVHFEVPKDVEILVLDDRKRKGFMYKIFLFPSILYKYIGILKRRNCLTSISLLIRPNLINCLVKILMPKTKVVISERCYPSIAYKSTPLRYRLYKILLPCLYNKADVLFSNSIFINEDLGSNFGVTKPLMKVMYNPIVLPTKTINKDIEDTTLFKVITVGKLNRVKNPNLILKALHLDPKNKSLTFVGEGDLRKELLEYVAKYNMSDVYFAGNVKNVNDYLLQAHCFVLSSNTEGFPNALLEAMAIGLPCISTNCLSGPLEILNEGELVEIANGGFAICKYGILINVNDDKGLINAINELEENSELYKALSAKSLERSQSYDVNKIFNEFMNILQ